MPSINTAVIQPRTGYISFDSSSTISTPLTPSSDNGMAGPTGPTGPAGTGLNLTGVNVGEGTFAMSPGNNVVIIKKSQGFTYLTLPLLAIPFQVYTIKDGSGNAAKYPTFVNGPIVDASTLIIGSNFEAIDLIFDGSRWNVTAVYTSQQLYPKGSLRFNSPLNCVFAATCW